MWECNAGVFPDFKPAVSMVLELGAWPNDTGTGVVNGTECDDLGLPSPLPVCTDKSPKLNPDLELVKFPATAPELSLIHI